MEVELLTERLRLRPLAMDDLQDVHQLIYSDPEVCRFYCGNTRSLEETRLWLAYRVGQARYSSFLTWAVVRRDDGRFIGQVKLEAFPNRWYRFPDDPRPRFNAVEVELAFAFGRPYWGQGYACEACRPVIDYAFRELRLPRLVSGASYENERSARLQARLGFRLTHNLNPEAPEWASVLENTSATTQAPTT